MRGAPPRSTRLKTARGRTASSVRWLGRQLSDPYVRAAKAEGWRSRAAFKLIELDARFKLLARARAVVDLGTAPGGWCQVVRKAVPVAQIVGIDLLAMDAVPGVSFFQMDFTEPGAAAALLAALGTAPDLVLSDMAANTTGHKGTDHLRTMALVEAAVDFAIDALAPGGAFVAKVLAGGTDPVLLARLKRHFAKVDHAKPPASRKESSEWYVIARGLKASQPAAVPPANVGQP